MQNYDILVYVISFFLFVLLQSIFINGVYISFQGNDEIVDGKLKMKGMILYPIGRWLKLNIKNDFFLKPLFICIKCMASFYGTITFWPIVIYIYGFNLVEIYFFVLDIFCLVYMNFLLYKKV